MKISFPFSTKAIFYLFLSLGLFAAHADAEESLVVTESGNVGIGTTDPNAKLHVYGSVLFNSGDYIVKFADMGNLQTFGGNGLGMRVGYNVYHVGGVGDKYFVAGHKAAMLSVGQAGGRSGDFEFWTSDTAAAAADEDISDWSAKMVVKSNGNVGIGTTSPGYTLDINGNIHCTGKLSSDGGNDPPYVLYNYETRESIVERVKEEIPPDKLDGAVLFFNGEKLHMEIFLPAEGEFRSLSGELLESIKPITFTFEVEERFYLDRKTGQVKRYKVRKAPQGRYQLRKNHLLDPKTGKCYQISRDQEGQEIGRIEVPTGV